MFIRRNPLVPYCWIPDNDPSIDRTAWKDEDQARYFSSRDPSYRLPPILPGETPMKVFLRPLSHAAFLRVQALEQQKGTDFLSDPEVRELILLECVTGVSGVGEETVSDDGTYTVKEIAQGRLFTDGRLNAEGLGFFHNPFLGYMAISVAWILSHTHAGQHRPSPQENTT